MRFALFSNLGGWIGHALARGNPMAWLAMAAVVIGFSVTYRLMAWWRAQ